MNLCDCPANVKKLCVPVGLLARCPEIHLIQGRHDYDTWIPYVFRAWTLHPICGILGMFSSHCLLTARSSSYSWNLRSRMQLICLFIPVLTLGCLVLCHAGLPAADKPKGPAAEPAVVPGAAPASSDIGHSTDSADSAKQANAFAKKAVAAHDLSSEPSLTAAFAQDAPSGHLNAANAECLPARVEDKKTAANAPAESAADPTAMPAGETTGVPAKAHLLKTAMQQGHVQSQQDTAQAAPFSPAAAAHLDAEDLASQKSRTTKEPGVPSADEPAVLVTPEDCKSQPSVDVPESGQQPTEGGGRKLSEGCKNADADGDSKATKTEPAVAKAAALHGDATSEAEGSKTLDGMLGSKQKPAVEPPHSAADLTFQQAALPLITGALPASAHTASASTHNESAFSEAAGKGANAVSAEAQAATADAPSHAHLHLLLRPHRLRAMTAAASSLQDEGSIGKGHKNKDPCV